VSSIAVLPARRALAGLDKLRPHDASRRPSPAPQANPEGRQVIPNSTSSTLLTAGLAVAGTLLTTGFGWLLSLIGQRRQHRLAIEQSRDGRESERLTDLHRRGREAAEHAVDALVVLRAELPKTVGGNWDEGTYTGCERELNNLEQLSLRLPEPYLRRVVDTASRALGYADQISQWSSINLLAHHIVRRASSDAIDALSAYFREEPLPSDMSADLKALAMAHDETIAELRWQDEQHREWEREEAEAAVIAGGRQRR
jgi:hypothetical protein